MTKILSETQLREAANAYSALAWVIQNGLMVNKQPFSLIDHPYEQIMLERTRQKVCRKWASQMGKTLPTIYHELHHLIYGLYPQGSMFIFPTAGLVQRFSQSRWTPLINDNKCLWAYISTTDTIELKRVGKSNLYFVGAKVLQRIAGEQKSSAALKSEPVDSLNFDEFDEIDPSMAVLALDRIGHSEIKNESYTSTPSIPDFGIDKMYCISPDVKILYTDLRWRRADKAEIGQAVVGFDEEKVLGNKTRRYKETKIISTKTVCLPSVKIYFDDGTDIICSEQHKWLEENVTNVRWKYAKNLKIGDKLLSIGMWTEEKSKEAGWLAGIFDGEGSIGRSKLDINNKRGCATFISFTQKEGFVFDRVKRILDKFGYGINVNGSNPKGCMNIFLKGGLPEKLRFLGSIRPFRLLTKSRLVWDNVSVGNDHGNTKKIKVVKIEEIGSVDLIALGTQSKTFIANGLLSHNSESDQNHWMIRCRHCGERTCLEIEFPECIKQDGSGRWYRACKKCGREIFTNDGEWIPAYPGREIEGTWISRLNLADKYVNLGDILKRYEDPPLGDKGKVMNGDLGMAYIEAENRLTASDLLAILGRDPMMLKHPGPTAAGVDLGNDFHVTIWDRPTDRAIRLVKACHMTSNKQKDFTPLHDLIVQFNIKCMVIDMQFEQAKVRRFIAEEGGITGCEIYGNIYQDHYRGVVNWDSKDHIVREDRTEIADNVHDLVITPGAMLLPRNSDIMQEFIKHYCNLAKVLKEDELTGSKEYQYRKQGPDHYRHSSHYGLLATKRIGVYTPKEVQDRMKDRWDAEEPHKTGWMGA